MRLKASYTYIHTLVVTASYTYIQASYTDIQVKASYTYMQLKASYTSSLRPHTLVASGRIHIHTYIGGDESLAADGRAVLTYADVCDVC